MCSYDGDKDRQEGVIITIRLPKYQNQACTLFGNIWWLIPSKHQKDHLSGVLARSVCDESLDKSLARSPRQEILSDLRNPFRKVIKGFFFLKIWLVRSVPLIWQPFGPVVQKIFVNLHRIHGAPDFTRLTRLPYSDLLTTFLPSTMIVILRRPKHQYLSWWRWQFKDCKWYKLSL